MACSLLHLARGPQPGPQRAVRCSLIMSMQVASYTCQHCTFTTPAIARQCPHILVGITACTGCSDERSELSVWGLKASEASQPLLAALLPRHQSLDALSLLGCQLDLPAFEGCSTLRSVTELVLNGCTGPGGSLDAGLAALLLRTPQLRRLTVQGCLQPDDPFPDSLRAFSGLSFLFLAGNALEDRPEGPVWAGGNETSADQTPPAKAMLPAQLFPAPSCLETWPPPLPIPHCATGLRSLDLSTNSFAVLPWALSTATQLTWLSVRADESFDYFIDSDDDLLVAHLPALKEFDMVRFEQAY